MASLANPVAKETEDDMSEDQPNAPVKEATPKTKEKRLKPETIKSMGIGAVSLLIGILLWHWASSSNLDFYINFSNVPTPTKVFTAFIGHIQTEIFFVHIGVSMRRALA